MHIDSGITAPTTFVTDGSIRCYFYARYSSDGQSRASIPDQFRNCSELSRRKGWTPLEHLNQSDEEMTGRTRFGRKGLDTVMAIAKTKPRIVDYLVCDDTSRLGRNAAETLQIAKILIFQGISLFFVEDALDSRDPSFWENFTGKAVGDERYSRSLGAKVKRGRRGRFIEGYNPGGGCFGYRNEPVFDHSRKGLHGMPFVKAVLQVIDPETAQVVLRIFNAYADGMSCREIAIMLNNEGIPTSQGPRSKREPSWSKTAIRTILDNSRYVGKLTWGTTREGINPENGNKVRENVPEAEWDRRDDPTLCIVPDELWARVQSLRKQKTDIGIPKTGGSNRTEASRRYLLNSLLRCGLCGGNVLVTTSNPTRYGCATHRNRGLCENRTTVKQEELEQAFVAALSDKLRAEDLREELVQTLHVHLADMKNQQMEADKTALGQKDEMVANRAKYLRNKANLLKAISEEGGCRSLYEELKEVEGKIARIDEILATCDRAPVRPITIEEVRTFVDAQAHRFDELLLGSAERVKAEFQRRIKEIILTPGIDEQGPFYTVSGDVDLFSVSSDAEQNNQVDLIALHCNLPIRFNLRPYTQRPSWALPKAA